MIGGQVRNYAKCVSLEGEKILVDGTRVPLGTMAYWHRNPLIRISMNLWLAVKRYFKLV